MDIETRRRIRAYKKALPELRERVIAVALLLAMSASMLTSASFAWLTISRRPEVSGVSTTVAANGNLEIALATGTTTVPVKPNESAVGDSSAAQDVTKANITWGNLINLSDPSYGLDQLTLRPAQLNRSSLLINPLFGAEYKGDGRVEKLNSNFGFSTWQEQKGEWRFFVSDDIGVRAISSTTVEDVGFATDVYNARSEVRTANAAASNAYIAITNTPSYMNTLATVMGKFMMAKMNKGQGNADLENPTVEQKDLQNLRDLFKDFLAVYDLQFNAMAEVVNFQLFLKNSSPEGVNPYDKMTAATIKETTEADLKAKGLQATGLNQAKKDYSNLEIGYEKMKNIADQGSVKWNDSGLNDIVNSLMNVGKCTLDGTAINNIGISNAFGYLSGTHEAVINDGVLYNFEWMNGEQCYVKGLTVTATIKKSFIEQEVKVKANISTSALQPKPQDPYIEQDLAYADTLNQGGAVTEVAQDTYGLALDLWVRTNAADSYLTLEGNVLTKSEMVQATGTDRNGETRDIYTLKRSVTFEAEDGTTSTEDIELDLYKIESEDSDGNKIETWYNAYSHATVELEKGETPLQKLEEVITVIGYEGENRIWEDANAWEDNSQLSLDSTTQGSGSCYVYYADSPEDQARSLELLDSMDVAFVDDEGVLMATAEMDTGRYYAENGRVTVPMVLRSDSLNIGTDDKGNTIYGITALEQNVPKRITAIVYLDGTELTNEHVLSASDIQGKLNIQFGSSELLAHAKDETLLNATRSVSASVSKNAFKYDESLETGTPMTTTVTVNVDGETPKTVTAFFIRAISSTQGSREEPMTFTSTDGGSTWTADYTFTAPGEYVLRSVDLDGQTYDLAAPVPVTVEGFTISSLTQSGGNHVSIMTASSSFSVDLALKFASSKQEAMPSEVQGRYLRQDGTAVNVNFTYNATTNTWNGKANFISSGDYKLQYLVLDGEYTELEESMWQSATVYLGMKVAVYTQSPTQFKYVPSELDDNQLNLYMQVAIMDNTGEEMQGLQDARLYYAMQGSSVNGMDAPLTWNAAAGTNGYYECSFPSNVGVYYFSHVTVGGNTITYAETAPRFNIQSPEPPGYVGFTPLAYRYNPSGNTDMQVTLTYSSTATVAAVIRNLGDNKTYEVQGFRPDNDTGTEGETWNFRIPTNAAGKQDGNWQLETVKVWNYYDAAGNYIKADVDENGILIADGQRDEPLEFSIDGHITKAVTTVNVTVSQIADAELGKEGNTITGKFMDSYTISGLSVKIEDFEHQEIRGLESDSVSLKYVYGNNSKTYGGYTGATNANADFSVKLTKNGTTYTQSEDVTVKYAGSYSPTVQFRVNGKDTTVDKAITDKMAFSIYSVAPTITITGRTNYAGSSTSGNTITVVFNYRQESSCGIKYDNYDHTSVTLGLEGIGKASSATLNFTESNGATVQLYTEKNNNGETVNRVDGYSWTTDGDCLRWVGYLNQVTGSDKITPAGTLTASELILVDADGVEYKVDIEDIIIINKTP